MNFTTIAVLAVLAVAPLVDAGDRPLKVYILVGQSNMQGKAGASTLPHMAEAPEAKALHDKIVDAAGKPRVYKDVCVAAFSQTGGWNKPSVDQEKKGPLTIGFGSDLRDEERFGPELGFGITIVESQQEPILIIKTAWGGKDLCNDFRSPGSGPYEFSDHQNKTYTKERKEALVKKTGHYYRLMAKHIKQVLADPGKYCPAYDPKQGYEIAGFVWFQGYNDMVNGHTYPNGKEPGGYDLYSKLLGQFIRDVRKEFKAPKMPFVIGVMGVGGNPEKPNVFRQAMAAPAALPEFKGNVVAVDTAKFWDHHLGELVDRGWRWTGKRNCDPENKYADLRVKLSSIQKELDETKKIKDGRERNKKRRAIGARMASIMYTPEEQRILKIGKSSQGFHYLGSAKIYGQIGEAFAKALISIQKTK